MIVQHWSSDPENWGVKATYFDMFQTMSFSFSKSIWISVSPKIGET